MKTLDALTHSENSFEGQKSYEVTKIVLRRHPFVLLVRFVGMAFLALAPPFLWALLGDLLTTLGLRSVAIAAGALYALVWWYGLFYRITMYLLDVWIVTDHRVIDSQQFGLFRRTHAELNLGKIQDISVSVKGGMPTLLDYGDVEIQTAAADKKFLFEQVPHPHHVKDLIMKAHTRYVADHPHGKETHMEV
ncbi:MAG: PH domain-containing protein [Candidatus Paceibacterota bacterium]|nr:MAG: PH domain-containing protein [Candidatus Paceibacterota bacterium]